MSIWIRSQDGGLGEYNNFLPPVIKYKEIPDPEGSPFPITTEEVVNVHVMGRWIGCLDVIGTYPTEAEALKVLDMIEGVLGSQTVFLMPEAGFSKEGE